jgi:hypothetical protein
MNSVFFVLRPCLSRPNTQQYAVPLKAAITSITLLQVLAIRHCLADGYVSEDGDYEASRAKEEKVADGCDFNVERRRRHEREEN